MFKSSKVSRKTVESYAKKNRDVTDWCSKNTPMSERMTVTVTEGTPPRTREVPLQGVLPFKFDGKDCSEWVMDFLDMRRRVLDASNSLVVRDTSFIKTTLCKASLVGSNARDVVFEGSNCELAVFNSAVLSSTVFDSALLPKASFAFATLERASLKSVLAPDALFTSTNLEYANLSSGVFCSKQFFEQNKDMSVFKDHTVALWSGANFSDARLRGADLRGGVFCGCDFTNANLTGAALQNGDFRQANFTGAKLCGANLSKANLLGAKGLDKADLTWAVIIGGVNTDLDLAQQHKDGRRVLHTKERLERYAKLMKEVNFSGTDLSRTNLTLVNLVGSSFKGADLRWANLTGATLIGCDFTDASLVGCNMIMAILKDAKFTNADMKTVNMSGVDMNQIKDALLEASNLSGMTCTLGAVPEELKKMGVLDSDLTKGTARVDAAAIGENDEFIKQQIKKEREKQALRQKQETEKANLEKYETMLRSAMVNGVSKDAANVIKMRLLGVVLRERSMNLCPDSQEEKDERWVEFTSHFMLSSSAPSLASLKGVYLKFISDEVKDDYLVMMWRRMATATTTTVARVGGSLENMCLESVSCKWSQLAARMNGLLDKVSVSDTGLRRTYLSQLFKGITGGLSEPQQIQQEEQDDQSTPATPPTIEQPPPPPPPSPAAAKDETLMMRLSPAGKSASNPIIATQQSPQQQQKTATPTPPMMMGSLGSGSYPSLPPFNAASSPSMLVQPPTSSPLRNISLTTLPRVSPPPPPVVPPPQQPPPQMMMGTMNPMMMVGAPTTPPPPMATSSLNSGGNMGMPIGMPGMNPMIMSAGSLPQQPPPQQQLNSGGGLMNPMMMGSGGMVNPMMNPMMGMQMGMMNPMMNPAAMQMRPMVGMVTPMGMPPMMQQQQQQQLSPQLAAQQQQQRQKVRCVECKNIMDALYMQQHKKECIMRRVSCAQCHYSMRYIMWDNHNSYCNKSGPCPLCARSIRDNMIIHLFEYHMQELFARGFCKGAEPPTKLK